MTTNLTVKGQVTVPKAIRDSLGLRPGDKVVFYREADGSARIARAEDSGAVAAPDRKTGIHTLVGVNRGKGIAPTTDEFMNLLRGYDRDATDPGFAPKETTAHKKKRK